MLTEFGPWIEHDGIGRPVPQGAIVEVEVECITGLVRRHIGVAKGDKGTAWDWSVFGGPSVWRVVRYRIQTPTGLQILREIATRPKKRVEFA